MHKHRTVSIAALVLLSACSQGRGLQPITHSSAIAPTAPIEKPEVQQPPTAAPSTTTTEATPETVPTTEVPATTAPSTTRVRVTTTVAVQGGDTLACIRSYEQNDNPRKGPTGYASDTGNGYYGAYQFTLGTWQSVGGSGNPAHASPAEQDMRAQMLLDRRGLAPWPTPAKMCQ
jgi:hypothetical protein